MSPKSMTCPTCNQEPSFGSNKISDYGNLTIYACTYDCCESVVFIRSHGKILAAFKGTFVPTNDIPERVLNVVSEAHLCFNVGAYRSTVITARAAIEILAKEQGVSTGTLKDRINEVFGKNNLITEASYEIKDSGNGGAHDKEDVARDVAQRALTSLGAILSLTYREIRTPRVVTPEELQAWKEDL